MAKLGKEIRVGTGFAAKAFALSTDDDVSAGEFLDVCAAVQRALDETLMRPAETSPSLAAEALRDGAAGQREFVLARNYFFLAAGTRLKRDARGDYYVSMSDDDWIHSGIHLPVNALRVEAARVEHRPEIFREVTAESGK